MSDAPKRFRFGLRLLLLVVALAAVLFACYRAVEDRRAIERRRQQAVLYARLADEEHRRTAILQMLNNQRGGPLMQSATTALRGELPKTDARISAIRAALADVAPNEDHERAKWSTPGYRNGLTKAQLEMRDEILDDLGDVE